MGRRYIVRIGAHGSYSIVDTLRKHTVNELFTYLVKIQKCVWNLRKSWLSVLAFYLIFT